MKLSVVISGNSASNMLYSLDETVLRWGAKDPALRNGVEKYISVSTRHFSLWSTKSELARKKLAPSKGRDT